MTKELEQKLQGENRETIQQLTNDDVWCTELMTELRIGDPDFHGLYKKLDIATIHTINETLAYVRELVEKLDDESNPDVSPAYFDALADLLTLLDNPNQDEQTN